jgi:hypothetical protein
MNLPKNREPSILEVGQFTHILLGAEEFSPTVRGLIQQLDGHIEAGEAMALAKANCLFPETFLLLAELYQQANFILEQARSIPERWTEFSAVYNEMRRPLPMHDLIAIYNSTGCNIAILRQATSMILDVSQPEELPREADIPYLICAQIHILSAK